MIWLFKQTGVFESGDGSVHLGPSECYSGHGEGKNNPEMDDIKDVGPIPRGAYHCGLAEDTETHGPVVIPLTPTEHTETCGRDGFLIHGDSVSDPGNASHGCVIVPRSVRKLINPGDLLLVWA